MTQNPDPFREIKRFHTIQEDFISGIRDEINPITNVLSTDFTSIGIDGIVRDRSASIETLEEMNNRYASSNPRFLIEVEPVEHVPSTAGQHMVVYTARWRINGEWKERQNTAWLQESNQVLTGLVWRHHHETLRTTDDSEEDNSSAADDSNQEEQGES